MIKLNIGAGGKRFEGWLSVGLEREHDIVCDVRSLPLPDNHADEAMAIHVLEHLHRWEAPAALAEWRRVLKPGARLVLELPDLIKCCANVLRDEDDNRNGVMGLFGDPVYRDPLMVHKWGWRVDELRRELKFAGFSSSHAARPQFHGKRQHRDMRIEAFK